MTDGAEECVRWDDWGEAVMLAFCSRHPRTRAEIEIRQAVRVPRDLLVDLKVGEHMALVCWGVMPSGILRHPVLGRVGAAR